MDDYEGYIEEIPFPEEEIDFDVEIFEEGDIFPSPPKEELATVGIGQKIYNWFKRIFG